MRLFRRYHREVLRCRDAKAYVAGCVLLGAALEVTLLAMTRIFPHHVRSRGKQLAKSWNLQELNQLACECGWLSERGYRAAERIREMRNIIHPDRVAGSRALPVVRRRTLDALLRDFDIVRDDLYVVVV